jgi:hypothetical protein
LPQEPAFLIQFPKTHISPCPFNIVQDTGHGSGLAASIDSFIVAIMFKATRYGGDNLDPMNSMTFDMSLGERASGRGSEPLDNRPMSLELENG